MQASYCLAPNTSQKRPSHKRRRTCSDAQEAVRKSRRLQEQQLHKHQQLKSADETKLEKRLREEQSQLPSPSPSGKRKAFPYPATEPPHVGLHNRKRHIGLVLEDFRQAPQELHQKRLRRGVASDCSDAISNRVAHWITESRWPESDFETLPSMSYPAPKRTRSSSPASQTDFAATPSDQKSRNLKSSYYTDPRYRIFLELKGSFMQDSEAGLVMEDKKFCATLLYTKQEPPSDSLFDDRFFLRTCGKIENKNETRVVRDIALLITPSAEILATRGAKELDQLTESTNAGWNKCIPFEGPRPQPDYSVGIRFSAFSDDQLTKLNTRFDEKTYFAVTEEMHFPFLTCEIKCGNQALNIADRQNAHSMTVAVRNIVELYRTVKRETELHRRVLAFSISHDHDTVKIYAHYPEIKGEKTEFYRHLVKHISIASEDGKDRWGAYQFTRNVYDLYAPIHLDRIRSAVNQLPNPTLESVFSMVSTEYGASPQETLGTSAPSSQGAGSFQKPAPRQAGGAAAAKLQATVEQLNKMMEQQNEQHKDEREQANKREERLLVQLEQWREEASRREERLLEQLDQQREEAKRREERLLEQLKQR